MQIYHQQKRKNYEFNIKIYDLDEVEICSCMVDAEQVSMCFCAFIDTYPDYLFYIERNKKYFCSGRLNNDFLDEVTMLLSSVLHKKEQSSARGNATNDSYTFEEMAICGQLKKKCSNEYANLIKAVETDDELAYRAAGRALCILYGRRRVLLLYGKKEPVLMKGIVDIDPVEKPEEYFEEAKRLIRG